jgi:hypothetical protein
MAVEKINAFYDDPVKQACDAQATHTAHYRRALTTGTELRWILHRRRLQMQWFVHGLVHHVSMQLKGQSA